MASYMDALEGKHTDGREQGIGPTDNETLARMEMALEQINSAIDTLSEIDGMESIMEELNLQAVQLEDEMAELESFMESGE